MASLLTIFALIFVALNVALTGSVIEPMKRINKKLEVLATKHFLTDPVNRRRFLSDWNRRWPRRASTNQACR